MVPSATPSMVRGIAPSWLAGYTSTLTLPPELASTPFLSVFSHSTSASPLVEVDSFIVNCCAPALPTQRANNRAPILTFMGFPSLIEQDAHSDERDLRNVRDQAERGQIDEKERHDAAVDDVQRQVEHRLGDENIDAEGRVEQADRQVHHHHDAEVDAVDARGLDDRHEQRAQKQDRR